MKQLFINELSSIDHGKDFNFTLDKSEVSEAVDIYHNSLTVILSDLMPLFMTINSK